MKENVRQGPAEALLHKKGRAAPPAPCRAEENTLGPRSLACAPRTRRLERRGSFGRGPWEEESGLREDEACDAVSTCDAVSGSIREEVRKHSTSCSAFPTGSRWRETKARFGASVSPGKRALRAGARAGWQNSRGKALAFHGTIGVRAWRSGCEKGFDC